MSERNVSRPPANRPTRDSRYYTPAARIQLVDGVTRKELNSHADLYSGSAEALERAGVLRADMLPAPGHVQIAWRPAGAKSGSRQQGRSLCWTPGYLEIRRHHDGTYRAKLVVSDEEQAARKKAEEAVERDFNAKRVADSEEGERPRSAVWDSDQLKRFCIGFVETVRGVVVAGTYKDSLPVEFTASGRDRIERILSDLEAAIAGAQVLPKRVAAGGKGHLRVAWSAT
jgi:hypothetical protein